MIPPFNLASDSGRKIHLREATVADAIDFADVDEGHEEQVTTLFLNRVQLPENFIDSRSWTAADRRLGLVWYHLHTIQETTILLPYECTHCGERHEWAFDMRSLLDGYKPIQGKPEREIEWKEERVKVLPLTGDAMETLELMYLALQGMGKGTGAYQKQEAKIRLKRFLFCIDFMADTEEDPEKRWKDKERRVLSMRNSAFGELSDLVQEKLFDLEHGLPFTEMGGRIHLITPPHECPKGGGTTRLRIPFRNLDYVSRI